MVNNVCPTCGNRVWQTKQPTEISNRSVYLACGSTNPRKSIDGLAVLVKESFHLDPLNPCLFVFCIGRYI